MFGSFRISALLMQFEVATGVGAGASGASAASSDMKSTLDDRDTEVGAKAAAELTVARTRAVVIFMVSNADELKM